ILGGERWLGGKFCQGRQPPKAGAAGPPLQGLPPSHTRSPRSPAGNIDSAGCLKTGPQFTLGSACAGGVLKGVESGQGSLLLFLFLLCGHAFSDAGTYARNLAS